MRHDQTVYNEVCIEIQARCQKKPEFIALVKKEAKDLLDRFRFKCKESNEAHEVTQRSRYMGIYNWKSGLYYSKPQFEVLGEGEQCINKYDPDKIEVRNANTLRIMMKNFFQELELLKDPNFLIDHSSIFPKKRDYQTLSEDCFRMIGEASDKDDSEGPLYFLSTIE